MSNSGECTFVGLFILEGRVGQRRLKIRYVPRIGTRDFGCGNGDDHPSLSSRGLCWRKTSSQSARDTSCHCVCRSQRTSIHPRSNSKAYTGNYTNRRQHHLLSPARRGTWNMSITLSLPFPVTRHHPKTDDCIFLFSLKYRGLLFSAAKVRTFCRVRCNFYRAGEIVFKEMCKQANGLF